MSNGGIKIPVSAQFDTSQVEQAKKKIINDLNAMSQALNKAGKNKFEPISAKSVDEVRKLKSELDALLKIDGDLRRRMQATGQGHLSPLEADYFKMYSSRGQALRKMQSVYQYMGGQAAHAAPGGHGGHGGGHGLGHAVGHVAQHALHMTNPLTGGAGSVASGAIGTGMKSGVGAGLMGLIGGFVGFGIHKAIEGVAEEIGGAEKEYIAFDRLKRSLGDVNVAFDALKYTVTGAANNVKITFAEAEKLGSQFAKLGNITSGGFVSLRSEIETGVGLSRAFGLDPSAGMGFLGQMRGMRATQDENGSKRMALLVGETIAKSDAFSKADEVMEAMANYTTQQTRQSLGAANTSGFAGMLSAMVGSKIPGLDPAGSAALLGRVNSTLAAGGGMGEASQFFTAKLGAKRGMDVFDTQLWREGGAFSTADGTFSGGGAVAEFYKKHGLSAPKGGESLLSATLGQIRSEHGNNPKMMLKAMANQMGISMSQAAALDIIKPNQMGEMEKYADLTKLNAGGIGNMSKVLFGTDSDRASVREGLLGREDLKAEDRKTLEGMTGKSVEEQKKILAGITAQYEQERTTGSDIRDSKNLLDNIKTTLAGSMLPIMNEMRAGIVYMAGQGSMTGEDIMRKVTKAELDQKKSRIEGRYSESIKEANKKVSALATLESNINAETGPMFGRDEIMKFNEDKQHRLSLVRQAREQAIKQRDDLVNERDSKIKAEEDRANVALGAFGQDMTRGYRNNNPGNLEASVDWKGMIGTDGRFAQFESPSAGYRALAKNLLTYQSKHGLNTIRGIISRWAPKGDGNNTEAYIAKVSKQMGISPDAPLNMRDQQTLSDLVKNIAIHENGYQLHDSSMIYDAAGAALGVSQGTPLPADSQAGRGSPGGSMSIDPLQIDIRINGEQHSSQTRRLNGRVGNGGRAVPFGERAYA